MYEIKFSYFPLLLVKECSGRQKVIIIQSAKNNSERMKGLDVLYVQLESREEKKISKSKLFSLCFLSFVVAWLHHVLFFRLRQSYFRELADSKLLKGQRSGGKALTLFTKRAAFKNQRLKCTSAYSTWNASSFHWREWLNTTSNEAVRACSCILTQSSAPHS